MVFRSIPILLLPLLLAAACAGSDSTADDASAGTTAPDAAGSPAPSPAPSSTPEPTPAPTTTPLPSPTATPAPTATATPTPVDAAAYEWTQLADDAPWGRRAGLRVIELDANLYLLGGRTPRQSTLPGDSDIFSDVWRSDDLGLSWNLLLESGGEQWAPRAYFQAVRHNGEIMILGGQDYGLVENPFCALLEAGLQPPPELGLDPDAPCPEFIPTSSFFNDVWVSGNGVDWEQRTAEAPWTPRAGLSAEVLGEHVYVLGGSTNDDSSIIGPDGPQRLYYNDVWRSTDGRDWTLMTDNAPWSPRAGASVVAFDGALWLFGGEVGFTCTPLPDCEPPYFNDVWRSTDGATWELVTGEAGWSKRPGHQCEVLDRQIVCFGGFGLLENPMDLWRTTSGDDWELLDVAPWNVTDQSEVKYDFDSIVVETDDGPVVLTFGGDRETFDFTDPENWLRVDDDVWRFGPS